jgi:methionine-rich copper-binding protein CopC
MKRISCIAVIISSFVMPVAALAHAHLVQSDPADGSTVSVLPDHFLLVFSESAHLTALRIQKEGDASPTKIEPLPKNASVRFLIPAPNLTPGVYTLTFRNVATDDDHVMSGSIRFTIPGAAKPASAPGK